jgi:hypothetical protein
MAKTKLTPKQIKVHQKIINSISNEKRHFDMSHWILPSQDDEYCQARASCKTASCMAGHLEAAYPRQAAKLLAENRVGKYADDNGRIHSHEHLAIDLYEHLTGEKCPLDFLADRIGKETEDITRKEAVAHLKGTSRKWPLLATDKKETK